MGAFKYHNLERGIIMNYYRCIEHDRIYTEQELEDEYKSEYAYDLEYRDISFSRWLGNCMTRNGGSLEKVYYFSVTVEVFCFERYLAVTGYSTMTSEQIRALLEERYDQWNNLDEFPEAEPFCCEEWMLMGLDELGISYTPHYLEDIPF